MKVLFYGGTRFVGKALVSSLLSKGHEIFVFTRGNLPVPENITHLKGDRSNDEDLKKLSEHSFDLLLIALDASWKIRKDFLTSQVFLVLDLST